MKRVTHTVAVIREGRWWRVTVAVAGHNYTCYLGGTRARAVRDAVAEALHREDGRHEHP